MQGVVLAGFQAFFFCSLKGIPAHVAAVVFNAAITVYFSVLPVSMSV